MTRNDFAETYGEPGAFGAGLAGRFGEDGERVPDVVTTYIAPIDGNTSVDDALGMYEVLTDETADLFALFSNGATLWDAQRKALWCELADEIRLLAAQKSTKMTESWIEQAAHAHQRYQTFLERSRQMKAEYHRAESQRQRLAWTIEHRRAQQYREAAVANLTRNS